MAKPPSSTRTIRLSDEAWAALKAAAEQRDTTINALVGRAVGFFLKLTEPNDDVKAVSPEVFAEIKRITTPTPVWPSGIMVEPHHTEDPAPKLTLGSAVTFGPRKVNYGELSKLVKGKK